MSVTIHEQLKSSALLEDSVPDYPSFLAPPKMAQNIGKKLTLLDV